MSLPGQIDLNDLVVFAAVLESGGFSAAAERLGVAPARVSIDIAQLETRLGGALFTRTTRKVTPTELGLALHAQAGPLLRDLLGVLDGLPGSQGALGGSLRVTAPADHVSQLLAAALVEFAELHPRLHIDLRSSDRVIDLVAEGIDVAIRMGWLRASSQRAVRLDSFRQYVVAAPAYLQRRGPIATPGALAEHDFVALSLLPTPLTWSFTGADGATQSVRMRSRMKVDSPGALRAAVGAGAGVTVLDEYSARDAINSGHLVRVLDGWTLPEGGVFAVYPPGRQLSAKARAFVDFYRGWLARRMPARG